VVGDARKLLLKTFYSHVKNATPYTMAVLVRAARQLWKIETSSVSSAQDVITAQSGQNEWWIVTPSLFFHASTRQAGLVQAWSSLVSGQQSLAVPVCRSIVRLTSTSNVILRCRRWPYVRPSGLPVAVRHSTNYKSYRRCFLPIQ